MYVKLVEALCAEHGINLMKVGWLCILLNVPFENIAFTWRHHLRYRFSREESLRCRVWGIGFCNLKVHTKWSHLVRQARGPEDLILSWYCIVPREGLGMEVLLVIIKTTVAFLYQSCGKVPVLPARPVNFGHDRQKFNNRRSNWPVIFAEMV